MQSCKHNIVCAIMVNENKYLNLIVELNQGQRQRGAREGKCPPDLLKKIQSSNLNIRLSSILTLTQTFHTWRLEKKAILCANLHNIILSFSQQNKVLCVLLNTHTIFLATCSQALEIFFPKVLFLRQFIPQIRYSHIIIIKKIFRPLYIKLKPQRSLINLFLFYFNFSIISILKHFIFTIEPILTTYYLKNRVKIEY